jgi:hypothetical protein
MPRPQRRGATGPHVPHVWAAQRNRTTSGCGSGEPIASCGYAPLRDVSGPRQLEGRAPRHLNVEPVLDLRLDPVPAWTQPMPCHAELPRGALNHSAASTPLKALMTTGGDHDPFFDSLSDIPDGSSAGTGFGWGEGLAAESSLRRELSTRLSSAAFSRSGAPSPPIDVPTQQRSTAMTPAVLQAVNCQCSKRQRSRGRQR